MTPIPARLMRAQAEAPPTRPRPTERDRQRRAYILDAATSIFSTHGRLRVTMADFATATGLSQRAIRHQIADLDHLFAPGGACFQADKTAHVSRSTRRAPPSGASGA